MFKTTVCTLVTIIKDGETDSKATFMYVLGVCIRSVCLVCTQLPLNRQATDSRCGMWFWEGLQCATKCEKDGKVYAVRISRIERGLEHLTKREDMISSRTPHRM